MTLASLERLYTRGNHLAADSRRREVPTLPQASYNSGRPQVAGALTRG